MLLFFFCNSNFVQGTFSVLSRAFASLLLEALRDEPCVVWALTSDQRTTLFGTHSHALPLPPDSFLLTDHLPLTSLFAPSAVWDLQNILAPPPTPPQDPSAQLHRKKGVTVIEDSSSYKPSGSRPDGFDSVRCVVLLRCIVLCCD